jgi:hypothetical protein
MAGGTSDWTTTFVDGGPPGNLEDEGNVDSDERQAYCRGGHWGTTTISAAMRFPQRLTGQSPSVGFRLALSLDQHTSSDLLVEPMKR